MGIFKLNSEGKIFIKILAHLMVPISDKVQYLKINQNYSKNLIINWNTP